ncbi:hypothetical protein PVK06_019905 [Gossypium arboreum]|uniref:Uncharacterized protein n=1 Tax=Gossypium arboreum TaxID=29729 RepID=A0ABR0PLF3_GOSAR|nr:hypothetical protein PVK06_019905 [Gossypium arboreum]
MVSYRKKSELCTTKKYTDPYTCVARGTSQDHSRLNSDMVVDIILLMVRAGLKVEIPVVIANIRSQYQYTLTPTYVSCQIWEPKYSWLLIVTDPFGIALIIGTTLDM